jgi:uncharacterized protein (TIGR02996 family)
MTDDRAFLDSLVADPADAAGWLVYADWLDERDDPRGEYLRLVHELSTNPDPARRRRLNAVRPTLPRDWRSVVEQPALVRANPTSYPASWSGVGLADLRPINATYGGNEYQSLPPVPVEWVAGFEDWFRRMADEVPAPGDENDAEEFEDEDMAELAAIRAEERLSAVPRLSDAAAEMGLRLPDSFATFFLDDRHRGLFHSVTDCFFNLPERIVPAAGDPEAGLVRFYSDSQGCLHWYLYLAPGGDECVVTSSTHLGGDWALRQMSERSHWNYDDEDEPGDGQFWFCAPSFAEFVVRMWLETMAWYSLHPRYARPIETRWAQAPEVRAYLDHYRTRAPA